MQYTNYMCHTMCNDATVRWLIVQYIEFLLYIMYIRKAQFGSLTDKGHF